MHRKTNSFSNAQLENYADRVRGIGATDITLPRVTTVATIRQLRLKTLDNESSEDA